MPNLKKIDSENNILTRFEIPLSDIDNGRL